MKKKPYLAFWYVMFICVLAMCCTIGFKKVDLSKVHWTYTAIGYFVVSRFVIRPSATRTIAYLSWKSFVPILQDYEYIENKTMKILYIGGYVLAIVLAGLVYVLPISFYQSMGIPLLDAGKVIMNMMFIAVVCTIIPRVCFGISVNSIFGDNVGYVNENQTAGMIFKLMARAFIFIPVLRTVALMSLMKSDINMRSN